MSDWKMDPRAGRYNEPLDLDFAVMVAKERIEEWSWAEDPHGYCHERTVLIALLRGLDERRRDTIEECKRAVEAMCQGIFPTDMYLVGSAVIEVLDGLLGADT